jgi:hypothetical protein
MKYHFQRKGQVCLQQFSRLSCKTRTRAIVQYESFFPVIGKTLLQPMYCKLGHIQPGVLGVPRKTQLGPISTVLIDDGMRVLV